MAALPVPQRDRRGGGGAVAAAAQSHFFSRTLKNCMNLVEFQCLQMKHPETK